MIIINVWMFDKKFYSFVLVWLEFDNILDETKNSFFIAACKLGEKKIVQKLFETGKIDLNGISKEKIIEWISEY